MTSITVPSSATAIEEMGWHPIDQTGAQDVFIVSYPKSGNTWYQNLVSGLVFGCNPALTSDHIIQELVPDVHSKKFFRRFGDRAFFKSHHLPQREYRHVVYLLRDGRDAMVSYFHHLNALNSTPVDFASVVKDGEGLFPGKWRDHVNAWIENPFKARLIVVRYEDLKRDCLKELRRLCEFLGIEREASWLQLVAEGAEFSRMQNKESTQGWANSAWPKDKKFVRRGEVGSYRDEMSQEMLDCFLNEAGETLTNHGYLVESNSTASPDQMAKPHPASSLEEAVCCLNSGHPREALEAFDRSLVGNPKQPQVFYGKAVALARLGFRAEAVEQLDRLVALKPSHTKARQLLVELGGSVEEIPASDAPLASRRTADAIDSNGYLKKLAPPATSDHCDNSEALTVTGLMAQASQALEAGQNETALQLLGRAKALRQPTRGLDVLRAKYHLRINDSATAHQALLEELRYFPDNSEAKTLLDMVPSGQPASVSVGQDESDFQEALRVIRPYTMLSVERLLSIYRLAKKVCQENFPGNFVECGVAGGGCSALLAFVAKRHSRSPRFVYACDSFAGLPAPTSDDHHDGASAEAAGWGAGTCAAPETSLREVCARLGVADLVRPIKGFFNETLPRQRDWFGMIALLHMDGDWYESTRDILHNLYDHVANDGVIQVDDYGFWAGCKKALHEFEGQRGLQFSLQSIDGTGVWFRKPDSFPVNSVLSAELIEQFHADDPARKGVISQMSQNERYQLYHLVRTQLPRRSTSLRFVEIGSYSGASLLLTSLALGRTVKGAQGFAVEPAGQPQFDQVIQDLRKSVVHLKAFSHEAAPQLHRRFERDGIFPEFIFVDGDHSYAGVKRDILDYYPLLAPGGIMAFHDYLPALTPENREAVLFPHEGNEPGIRQACQEVMEEKYHCEVMDVPLLHPTDPTQTQAHFPIIPGVYSTLRAYRKPIV